MLILHDHKEHCVSENIVVSYVDEKDSKASMFVLAIRYNPGIPASGYRSLLANFDLGLLLNVKLCVFLSDLSCMSEFTLR